MQPKLHNPDADDSEQTLTNLAETYEGRAAGYRSFVAKRGDRLSGGTRAALQSLAAILDAIALALAESAREGHTAPVQSLQAATDEWLAGAVLFEPAPVVRKDGTLRV